MTVPRARARVRPFAGPANGMAASEAPSATTDHIEDVSPDTARMRRALELTAANRTQAEIATVLGCSERTVRNILKAGRARQLHTFKARSAEAVMADVEHRAAVQLGRWSGLWARAKAAGDLRTEALILAKMDAASFGRVATLARVGFFDGTTFNTGTDDAGSHNGKRDREEIGALVAMSAALNRGDDMDAIQLSQSDELDIFDPEDPHY